MRKRTKKTASRVSAAYAKTPGVKKGIEYCEQVVAGKIPAGKLTVLACQRQLKDLQRKRFKYYFDPEEAERFITFIEMLPHTKGRWAAKRELITLSPWQLFLVGTLFGWLRKKDDTRRFRECYWSVPRKNGKSVLAAGIGLAMMLIDGEFGAEVYSGATSEKQAWEVFRPAKKICLRTPDLCAELGVDVMAKALAVPGDGSKFEPIIGNPGDGSSPSCAIVDEYHEHRTPDLYDTMVSGMGARDQPLLLTITTAGAMHGGPCYDHQRQCALVLQGALANDELFACVWHADDDDDWSSPDTLAKANPNMGVSVGKDYLITQQKEAIASASKQSRFKTKHLNQWVSARAAFFNIINWNRCGSQKLHLEQFKGQAATYALDLASKSDLACVKKLFTEDRGSLHYFGFPRFYLPYARLEDDKTGNYARWHALGYLQVTDGNEISFADIRDDLFRDLDDYPCEELVYDPWRATQLAQEISDQVTCVEYRQTVQNMSEPMYELEAAIDGKRWHHDKNEIMTYCISNVTAKIDAKGNVYPRKEGERNENKIDGAVAAIMSIGRTMHREDGGSLDGWLSSPIVV